jgi:hypothetical protein
LEEGILHGYGPPNPWHKYRGYSFEHSHIAYLPGLDLVFYGSKFFISVPDFQKTRDVLPGKTAYSPLFLLYPSN